MVSLRTRRKFVETAVLKLQHQSEAAECEVLYVFLRDIDTRGLARMYCLYPRSSTYQRIWFIVNALLPAETLLEFNVQRHRATSRHAKEHLDLVGPRMLRLAREYPQEVQAFEPFEGSAPR